MIQFFFCLPSSPKKIEPKATLLKNSRITRSALIICKTKLVCVDIDFTGFHTNLVAQIISADLVILESFLKKWILNEGNQGCQLGISEIRICNLMLVRLFLFYSF